MRILFIKSTINSVNTRIDFGVASLAAVLKQHGHEADLFVVRNWDNLPMLEYRINTVNPDILAFTTYASAFQNTVKISNILKKRFPYILQIMGGVHIVLNPDEIRNAPSVDAVCVGEGEYALLDLIKKYKYNRREYVYVKGFWTRKGNTIVRNPTIPFVNDLDHLPFPDRKIFIQQGISFFRNNEDKKIYLDFLFTRGCPFTCTYCSNYALSKVYWGQKYVRRLSPIQAIKWIQYDLSNYACDCISILDDTFTLDKHWTEEFLSLYKQIHVPFDCHLRVGTFDKTILQKLKNSGCVNVFIGVESGDESLRKNVLRRPITDGQIVNSLDWVKKLHMKRSVFVMIGLPTETPAMWLKTVKLLARLSPVMYILNVFYPYPGTELYDLCKKKGYLRNKQEKNFIEGRDTILKMPQFSRNDILYYQYNLSNMISLSIPVKNFCRQLHRQTIFFLISIPPKSKWYSITHIFVSIDNKVIRTMYHIKNIFREHNKYVLKLVQ